MLQILHYDAFIFFSDKMVSGFEILAFVVNGITVLIALIYFYQKCCRSRKIEDDDSENVSRQQLAGTARPAEVHSKTQEDLPTYEDLFSPPSYISIISNEKMNKTSISSKE